MMQSIISNQPDTNNSPQGMNSEHDLPQLETTNETRFCENCGHDTVHRVGIREQHAELTRYFVYMKHEYAHCDECTNTRTVQLEKIVTPKS